MSDLFGELRIKSTIDGRHAKTIIQNRFTKPLPLKDRINRLIDCPIKDI